MPFKLLKYLIICILLIRITLYLLIFGEIGIDDKTFENIYKIYFKNLLYNV